MSERPPSPGESFSVQARGECVKCGEKIDGWIAFDNQARVIDSGGFMVFAEGLTCEKCLGETSEQEPRSL